MRGRLITDQEIGLRHRTAKVCLGTHTLLLICFSWRRDRLCIHIGDSIENI